MIINSSEMIKKATLRQIRMFSSVSGIQTTWVELHKIEDMSLPQKPCVFCNNFKSDALQVHNCHYKITRAAVNATDANYGLLFFCSSGLCHILVPVYNSGVCIGTIITEPLLCGNTSDTVREALFKRLFPSQGSEFEKHARSIRSLQVYAPAKLSRAARLMAAITLQTPVHAGYLAEVLPELEDALEHKDAERTQALIQNFLTNLISVMGDAFDQIKLTVIRFIFMLYEHMEDYGNPAVQLLSFEKLQASLSAATCFGDLKSCIDIICDEFMHVVFYELSLKHMQLLKKALDVIHQNYRTHLTQQTVAGHVFLSPSYFSKIFKEGTGYTFNEYLNRLRIEKAKELLTNTNIEIEQIPNMVGYEDRSYFGKIFRRLTDTTPKRYRVTHI